MAEDLVGGGGGFDPVSGWFDNSTTTEFAVELNCTAGKYNDGTCIPVWPRWVEVGVPLACVAVFVLTLSAIFMLPSGTRLGKKQRRQRSGSDARCSAVEVEQVRLVPVASDMTELPPPSSSRVSGRANGSISKTHSACNGYAVEPAGGGQQQQHPKTVVSSNGVGRHTSVPV